MLSVSNAGERLRGGFCALVAAAPIGALAAVQGGYFPTAWGWAAFALLWVVGVTLVIRPAIQFSALEKAFIVALAALTTWVAASTSWSVAPAETVLEVERILVYVAAVAAVLVVSRSRSAEQLLAGLLGAVAIIAAFSLATRLFPDRIGVYDRISTYRLSQPIGYWNGLAIFTAMGALLALGFAARARTLPTRIVSAMLLVLLLPTFYFTFGRAGWIALAVGVGAALLVDPNRLQLLAALLALSPLPAVGIWLASREHGLTRVGSALTRAASDGHRLAVVLAALAVGNGLLAAGLALLARRVGVSFVIRRSFGIGVALLAIALLAAIFVRYGGPQTIARKGYDAFRAPPPHATANLNKRLLSFSGNGRAALWRLAWEDARDHPWLGAGAGTYERYFLSHQPKRVGSVHDAHGLYVETLAELGPVGLVLLLAMVAIPLAAVKNARRHPLVPLAFGGYCAFLVHAGVDWDWELPAVTLVGLLCGTAILVAARRSDRSRPLSLPVRWIAGVAAVGAVLFSTVAIVGNSALSASVSAREQGNWSRAATDARRARRWMPWSPEPWLALGRAQLGASLLPQARKSFRKAISIDSGDWRVWYELARASNGGERSRALRHADALVPRLGLASGRPVRP